MATEYCFATIAALQRSASFLDYAFKIARTSLQRQTLVSHDGRPESASPGSLQSRASCSVQKGALASQKFSE
eukprot:15661-Heterococcus_DN1.PRE.2